MRADAELAWIDGYQSESEGGLLEWLMARVTARLGRSEEAVQLLNEALRKGHGAAGWWLHAAIDFAPLVGYAPFEEFARPKG